MVMVIGDADAGDDGDNGDDGDDGDNNFDNDDDDDKRTISTSPSASSACVATLHRSSSFPWEENSKKGESSNTDRSNQLLISTHLIIGERFQQKLWNKLGNGEIHLVILVAAEEGEWKQTWLIQSPSIPVTDQVGKVGFKITHSFGLLLLTQFLKNYFLNCF